MLGVVLYVTMHERVISGCKSSPHVALQRIEDLKQNLSSGKFETTKNYADIMKQLVM